jgi:hypothetical protein
MTGNDLSDKVAAAKQVTEIFKVERIVYVSIIAVCLVILLTSVVMALVRGKMGYVELTPMFGSGGGVAYLSGRLLHMWNRTMNLLGTPIEDAGNDL